MSASSPHSTASSRPVGGRSALRPALALGLAAAFVVAACGSSTTSPTVAPTSSAGIATPTPVPTPTPLRLIVGLGYVPNVQFAPFYLAVQRGYYAEAGLEVELQNKIDPDLVTLLGQRAIDIGSADGTSVIAAVAQGIPVVYTATLYGTSPNVVFAKASSGIRTAADLKGKRIGIPGKYGSSWIMLRALLVSAGLTESDVEIVPFPDFGQGVAVREGVVDAATGFVNNEPVQLELTGEEVVVLAVPAETPLPGPGLVTSPETIASKGDGLRAFVAATLRAMEEIAADPQLGLDAAAAVVPDLDPASATQRAILDATIRTWRNERTGGPIGSIDREGWAASVAFMRSIGLAARDVAVDELVTEELLPAR